MQFITTFVTLFVTKFITKFGDSLDSSPNLVTNLVTNLSQKTLGLLVQKIITEEEVLNIGPGVEVVVAAGAWTPLLLSTMGLFCPVYPMKGYSVAMDLPPHGSSLRIAEEDLPKRMLVDGKLYVTRLGEQVP